MQPHQQRVVDELLELTDKSRKLAEFLDGKTPARKSLLADEVMRLRRQFDIMVQYEVVLRERIAHFTDFNPN